MKSKITFLRLAIAAALLAGVFAGGFSSRTLANGNGQYDWCQEFPDINGDQEAFSFGGGLLLSLAKEFSIPDECTKTCPDGSEVLGSTYDLETFTYPDCPEGDTGNPHRRNGPPVELVFSGENHDIWYGNCGAHLTDPPLDGVATITKVGKRAFAGNGFIIDVCNLNYFDSEGNFLSQYFGVLTVYFNLDQETRKLFNQGELDLFYFDGDKWVPCNTTADNLLNDGSEYGRLFCVTNSPTMFALGMK